MRPLAITAVLLTLLFVLLSACGSENAGPIQNSPTTYSVSAEYGASMGGWDQAKVEATAKATQFCERAGQQVALRDEQRSGSSIPGGPRSQRSRSDVLIPVPGKQPPERRYMQPLETRSAWRPSKNALTGSSLIPTVTSHACRRRASLPKRSGGRIAGSPRRDNGLSCRKGNLTFFQACIAMAFCDRSAVVAGAPAVILTSAFGTKRTSRSCCTMSPFGGKADIGRRCLNVRL